MARHRRFRFGVQVARAPDAKAWTDIARKAEDLGFDVLTMPDHFNDQFAPGPALMAAAAATTTLRVGHLVLGNDYRHPVVLAKEVATLDVLSGGRVELGLGAGWMRADYQWAGIEWSRPDIRIARLEESLRICKGLWADGEFSFDGEHYRIDGLDGSPKPIQQPGVPIMVGGGGPKLLGVAVRHANIVGVNMPIPDGDFSRLTGDMIAASAVDERLARVHAAAGDRIDDIELSVFVYGTCVGADWRERGAQLEQYFGVTGDLVADTPHLWVGDAARVADQLRAARERWGFRYIVVYGAAAMDDAARVIAEINRE